MQLSNKSHKINIQLSAHALTRAHTHHARAHTRTHARAHTTHNARARSCGTRTGVTAAAAAAAWAAYADTHDLGGAARRHAARQQLGGDAQCADSLALVGRADEHAEAHACAHTRLHARALTRDEVYA